MIQTNRDCVSLASRWPSAGPMPLPVRRSLARGRELRQWHRVRAHRAAIWRWPMTVTHDRWLKARVGDDRAVEHLHHAHPRNQDLDGEGRANEILASGGIACMTSCIGRVRPELNRKRLHSLTHQRPPDVGSVASECASSRHPARHLDRGPSCRTGKRVGPHTYFGARATSRCDG